MYVYVHVCIRIQYNVKHCYYYSALHNIQYDGHKNLPFVAFVNRGWAMVTVTTVTTRGRPFSFSLLTVYGR